MSRTFRLLVLLLITVALAAVFVPVKAYEAIPDHNSSQTHFDTLIVLGVPADKHGMPPPDMRERVAEGVRQYRAGVAPHIIMTGGAAHNRFVEGQVMADVAVSQGVPRNAIVVEGQAQDTIQNIWYSREIMRRNGWHSAEVISSPIHLARTALILQHYKGELGLAWKTQASRRPPEYGLAYRVQTYILEQLATAKFRLRELRPSAFLPAS